MANGAYRRNHYVPQWYQRRFLPATGERKFHYLDLKPDSIVRKNRPDRKRQAVLKWGTKNCFFQKDLYTTTFNGLPNTDIEQYFFGKVDSDGGQALDYFSTFMHPHADGDAYKTLVRLMSLQKLRTPKGLTILEQMVGLSRDETLIGMQRLKNIYCAIWSECIWQIVTAEESPTKFIISDHPVTVYNGRCPPGTAHCRGAEDPDIRLAGTHTIYPLSLNKALVLTNVTWLRNPLGNSLAMRPNPSLFRPAMFNFMEIQVGRYLSEIEVQQINFIIKRRAYRYIAAAEQEWLYPENKLKNTNWFTLGGGDLLMPDPRSASFTTKLYVGYDNGIAEGYDAYGRTPRHQDYGNKAQAKSEWVTFQAAKKAFAKKFGPKRRGRCFNGGRLDPEEDSAELHSSHLGRNKGQRKAPKEKMNDQESDAPREAAVAPNNLD